MHLSFKLVNGEELDFDVTQKTVVIGRSSKCEVVIPHEGVSRQHCQLDFENGEVFVTDLGSTNGVLIDGVKIQPHQKVPYATFLTLSFGAVQSLSIEIDEPTRAGIKVQTSTLTSQSSHQTHSTTTKTSVMKELKKEATKPSIVPNKSQKKDGKSQQMAINVLAALILAAAVWWYMQKEDTPEAPVAAPAASAPTKTYDSF